MSIDTLVILQKVANKILSNLTEQFSVIKLISGAKNSLSFWVE